jgi:5-methyltetrahydropteroyltriglutamate--homocysteine methyltransferase
MRKITKQGGSLMTRSCDVGSLPLIGDSKKFVEGASRFSLYSADESAEFFEKKVLEGLLDKIRVGIDVPNFPQFRDMSEMFLSMMDGIERIDGGYLETMIPSLKTDKSCIPEVTVIKKHSQMIQETKGAAFEVRICVTGPYTLSSFFPYKREDTFIRLGNVISQIVENSIFNDKHGRVSLVSVDEPVFGLQDDSLIDFGSEGRENLQRAWESIFHKIKSKKAQTLIHLHSTVDELFWDIESLEIIESHVDDPINQRKNTKEKLESTDKFLKASVAVNDFDALIKKGIVADSPEKLAESDLNERIADAWTDIKHGLINPEIFLESVELMKSRLVKLVERFGVERVLYVGPECGLKGYPTYETALECLRRVSSALKSFEK